MGNGQSASSSVGRQSPANQPFYVSPSSPQRQGDPGEIDTKEEFSDLGLDLTTRLSNDCLDVVFGKLQTRDRSSCSLVCKRWYSVESSSRQLLMLSAKAEIADDLGKLLVRFGYLTKLALKCERNIESINDEALVLVGRHARQLQRLKLKGCKLVTDAGLEGFSKLCGSLRKLSCGSCGFGSAGLAAVVANCTLLEELSVKRLKTLVHSHVSVGPSPQKRLRRLCLKDLANVEVFEELISDSTHLKVLVLARLYGDWDTLLERASDGLREIMELKMEKLQLGDAGLRMVAKFKSLQVLYIVKCPEITNVGIAAVANGCRSIRKLHVDGCFMGRIGDEGVRAVSEKCSVLQELVLIRMNVRAQSLAALGGVLERLAVCNSELFGDRELTCATVTLQALRKLCIKSCPISDVGLEALAGGCPSLIKVKIKKCRRVTGAGVTVLRGNREGLSVVVDVPVVVEEIIRPVTGEADDEPQVLAARPRPGLPKARFAFLAGTNFVACTLRRRAAPGRGT